MSLTSMTGFGRSEGSAVATQWVWEVRTVNGRGLDLRLRLAPGTEGLEPRLREVATKKLARGSVNATLTTRQAASGLTLKLNEQVLDDLLKSIEVLRARVGGPPPTAESLLAFRGLIDTVEATEDAAAAQVRADAMVASFEAALDGVIASRRAEGKRLADVIRDQLATVEHIVAEVSRSPARSVEAAAARLAEQVQKLLAASGNVLDPVRLHQEAALIATRIDVEEELKRLTAHVAAAQDLLKSGEPVGRKFDFLTQEFNREANTLCSKANDPGITRAGLELKAVIDQMREQVQNIE